MLGDAGTTPTTVVAAQAVDDRDASQLAVNAYGEAQPAAAIGEGGPHEAYAEPQPAAAIDGGTPHEEAIQHKQNDSDASQLAVHAYGEPRATAAIDAGTPHEDAIQHDGAMVLVDVLPLKWNGVLGIPRVRLLLKLWWCKGNLNMSKSVLANFEEPFTECGRVFFLGSTAQLLFDCRDSECRVYWLIKHLQELHREQKIVPVLMDRMYEIAFQASILELSAKIKVDGSKCDFIQVNIYDTSIQDENDFVQVVDCLKCVRVYC